MEKNRKPHKNLNAWQKAVELTVLVYEITKTFPPHEAYGLSSQMKRAAVSVPSNIAEGASGRTQKQFYNYLSTAIGSLNELDTQTLIAQRVGLITDESYEILSTHIDDCLALLYGLRKSVMIKIHE